MAGTKGSWGLAAAGALCMALAAALRFYRLDAESLWLDEIFSVNFVAVRSPAQVVTDVLHMDYHPPGWYLLLNGWASLWGCSDYAMRALSAVLGVAAVPVAVLLCWEAFRCRYTAGLCGLLLAISPTHLRYAQEVRMYVLLVLLWPLVIWALLRVWRHGARWGNGTALLLATTALAYSHGGAGLLTLPFVVVVLGIRSGLDFRREGYRRAAVGTASLGALCALACVPWMLHLGQLSGASKTLDALTGPALFPLFHWILLARETILPAAAGVAILAGAGALLAAMAWCHRRSALRAPLLLLLASVVALPLTQWLLDHYKPSYQQRSLILLLVPILALASYGSVWLVRAVAKGRARHALAGLALAPICCLAIAMAAVSCQNLARGYGKEPWREAVEQVRQEIRAGDVVLIHADYTAQCWRHYYEGYRCHPAAETVPRVVYREFRLPKPPRLDESLSEALAACGQLREGNSVWAFYSHASDPDRIDGALRGAGWTPVSAMQSADLSVLRYGR